MSSFVIGLVAVFAVCFLIQIIFITGYFARLGSYMATSNAITTPSQLGISVVCCAHNETENLQKLIPALLAQQYPNFEIIIVDDRSGDEMYDYLLELERNEKKVKLVRIDHTPEGMNFKKFALTMGIKAAQFPHVLLTDADCLPASEHWIAQMAAHFNPETKIVLGYSLYRPYKGLLNALIRYETLFTCTQYLSMAIARHPYMGIGRNLAYSKDIFLDNKGFFEHITITGGDDDLFVNRVAIPSNTDICIAPDSLTWSEPKHTFKAWYRQKQRHLSVGKYYRFKDQWWLGLLSLSHLGVWVTGLWLCAIPELFWAIGLAGLVLRSGLHTWVMARNARQLNETLAWYAMPFLDFLQVFYPVFFTVPALILRRKSWN